MFSSKRPMKLRCKITLEQDNSLTASAKLYDGTPFSLNVRQHDVKLNEEFRPSKMAVNGWLYVTEESREIESERVALTLPRPTIQYGHNITVNALDLMPRDAKIEDFIGVGGKPRSNIAPVTLQDQNSGIKKKKKR